MSENVRGSRHGKGLDAAVLRFRAKALVRRFNRLRWLGKTNNLRRHGRGRMTWRAAARYVLWSPELGDYSFELADRDAMIEFAGSALHCPPELARQLLAELDRDERLKLDVAERRRRALLDAHPPLGQRRLWWVAVRLLKPDLVVETGVWYGLGSAVILRALELNAREGFEGRLMGFDPDPSAGWLVHPRHRGRWIFVRDTTEAALEERLRGRGVGLFISDTPADHDRERYELEIALAHAASPAVLLAANGPHTPALENLCRERGLEYHHLPVVAADHFYSGPGIALAFVPPEWRDLQGNSS